MMAVKNWKPIFIAVKAIWARDYKTFFMLNPAEREILNAHKYKNIKTSGSDKPRMIFYLFIKVEMPTIVGCS